MGHCVGAYHWQVETSRCAVYRVLFPERATLSLRWREEEHRWIIDQLVGRNNGPVSAETHRAVKHWLDGTGEENTECGAD